MIDLVKLRELASAATPGPYSFCTANGGCFCGMVWAGDGDNTSHIFTAEHQRDGDDVPKPSRDEQRANMAYVSALAPEVILELLNRLEQEIEHRSILAADMSGQDYLDALVDTERFANEVRRRLLTEIDEDSLMRAERNTQRSENITDAFDAAVDKYWSQP